MRCAQHKQVTALTRGHGPALGFFIAPCLHLLTQNLVAPGPCHRVQALKRGGAQSAYLITAFAAAAVASVVYIAMSRGGAEEGSGEAGGGAVGRAAGKDSTGAGTAGKGKRSRR
jgi:hypothetical protein